MKKILFVLFLLPLFAAAQKGKDIKPVKMHTVGPKESLSSIGRLYEVNGRVLANYNNIDYEKGISIGQVLKIPPKGTTIDQVTELPKEEVPKVQPPVLKAEPKTEVKAEPKVESGAPVYHKVGKKETLFHISTLYPGVTIDDLKKWNNLTGDGVTEGANLIVGYKKTVIDNKKTAVEKTEKEKPVVVTEPVKKEPVKQVKEVEKTNPPRTEPTKADVAGKSIKGGAFKAMFESQNSNGTPVNEEGSLGVFKSTSGWNDGKYYCLYNNASPGTVIKISIPATGKFVYVKVLDIIPDLKQNAGLLILISNAAADELGATDNNTNCSISYSK